MRWPWAKPPPPPPPPPKATMWGELVSWWGSAIPEATPEVFWPAVSNLVLALFFVLVGALYFFWPAGEGDSPKLLAAEAKRRAFRRKVIDLTFRAMKTVAAADGVFHPKERELLQSVADSLTVRCPDLDSCPTVEAAELAEHVTDRTMRLRMLVLMVHVALVDGSEDASEYTVVKRFASAFEVSEELLDELRGAVSVQHSITKSNLTRKTMMMPGPGTLARSPSAVLLASSDFNVVLESLCHR